MPVVNFTDRKIQSLKAEEGKQVYYWDDATPGFGLRVSWGGRKTWIFQYRPLGAKNPKRLQLGHFPEMTLTEARAAARENRTVVDKGGNPVADKAKKKAEISTVRDLATLYMEEHSKKHKASWKKDDRMFEIDVLPEIGNHNPRDVTRADIKRTLNKVVERGAPIKANRVFELLRAMFKWAVVEEHIPTSPCDGLKRPTPKENVRRRDLKHGELREIWQRIGEGGTRKDGTAAKASLPIQICLKLLMLTGQRVGEVSQAEKSEFDLEGKVWTIPGKRTKNRKAHGVPLTEPVLELLNQAWEVSDDEKKFPNGTPYLFPSPKTGRKGQPAGSKPIGSTAPNHALNAIMIDSEIMDVRPHDFREAVASGMASIGINELHAGAVLNHTRQNVTARHYNQYQYTAEKRVALEAWAQRLLAIVSGAADNVVDINARKEHAS